MNKPTKTAILKQSIPKVNQIDCDSSPHIILADNVLRTIDGEIVHSKKLEVFIRRGNKILGTKNQTGEKVLINSEPETNEDFSTAVDGFMKFITDDLVIRTSFSNDYLTTYNGVFDLQY